MRIACCWRERSWRAASAAPPLPTAAETPGDERGSLPSSPVTSVRSNTVHGCIWCHATWTQKQGYKDFGKSQTAGVGGCLKLTSASLKLQAEGDRRLGMAWCRGNTSTSRLSCLHDQRASKSQTEVSCNLQFRAVSVHCFRKGE
jgi:hypothetical protein